MRKECFYRDPYQAHQSAGFCQCGAGRIVKMNVNDALQWFRVCRMKNSVDRRQQAQAMLLV